MSETTDTPEGQVADAVKGNWVDTLAPAWSAPLPAAEPRRPADRDLAAASALLVGAGARRGGTRAASAGTTLWIAVGCALGAFLMRGAGCTWNDLTDRDIDAQVARTRSRPLPSGQVSARQALVWLVVQALLAFAILLTFNWNAILLGVVSLVPVAIYPFAKRFTWWPQVFLGLAFNWGALLAWTAHTGTLALARRAALRRAESPGRSSTTRSTPIRTARTTR